MRYSPIAAAVAATLAAGAAYALPPTTTTFGAQVVVAGSSAFSAAFKQEFTNICTAGTLDAFTAAGSPAPAMAAYSCTLNANAGAALSGQNAIMYYRAEGGSAYGVAPIAKGQQIYRLTVNGTCTGATPTWTCPVTGWNFAAESGSGNIQLDTVELGVSDVEPAKFVGDNWPGGFFGSAPTAAQLNNITSIVPVVGQVFAIYTSANVGASPLNLSRAGIAAILQGSATNWNQVPLADGSGFVNSNLPIKICNRDKGSGTRAGAGFFFNDYGCSASGAPLATTGALAINASTGTELTCISGAPATEGRIGYAVVQNAVPAGTSIANINGVAPSVTNAANGTYPYWYEATFNHGTNLTGNDLTLSNVLAARVQNTAVLPSPNPNLLPLADYNTPTLAISATAPVAITTHSGGSCNVPATVF